VSALQRATRTVPVVFVNVIDPVGAGFVDSFGDGGAEAVIGGDGSGTNSFSHTYSAAGSYTATLVGG
jgi:PKD repeat protein